jgi:RsiW-degrading membrane proteinase PrsW (M82 family)
MTISKINQNTQIKLSSLEKKIWYLSFIGCAIYSITVLFIIMFTASEILIAISLFAYLIISPIIFYGTWCLLYFWKTKKLPERKKIIGSHLEIMLFFFLLGVCVICWAAYWNTGFNLIWLLIANVVFLITDDVLLFEVVYIVGASAITPALVEEFLKALPSILAFFVVLQRKRSSDQKGKGIIGNELHGFLMGLMVGIAFEVLEAMGYVIGTIFSGGTYFDIYLQSTIRLWAPIHILGGAISGYAVGRAERLRFELGEENLPLKIQIKTFLKRFIPYWLIPVSIHFAWNSSSVWIILIDFALNGEITILTYILLGITYATLASLAFVLLIIFFKRANKIAQDTLYCSETGMIVSNQSITYQISDKPVLDPPKIISNAIDENDTNEGIQCPNCNYLNQETFQFCINCGINIQQSRGAFHCPTCGQIPQPNARFCKNCGLNFAKYKTLHTLYQDKTVTLFKFLIAAAIIFTAYSVLMLIAFVISFGAAGFLLILSQFIAELICAGLIFFSASALLKLRKNYNGKKSIWVWMFFVFNLIGLTGALLVIGIAAIIGSFISGNMFLFILLSIVGIIFLHAGIFFLFRLQHILFDENQTLHYERNF